MFGRGKLGCHRVLQAATGCHSVTGCHKVSWGVTGCPCRATWVPCPHKAHVLPIAVPLRCYQLLCTSVARAAPVLCRTRVCGTASVICRELHLSSLPFMAEWGLLAGAANGLMCAGADSPLSCPSPALSIIPPLSQQTCSRSHNCFKQNAFIKGGEIRISSLFERGYNL